jgi:hypothetical protein
MSARPWLWPDHAIGKREARRLREEHNATVNEHADLLAALRAIIARVDGVFDDPALMAYGPLAGKDSDVLTIARAAIAKAERVTP